MIILKFQSYIRISLGLQNQVQEQQITSGDLILTLEVKQMPKIKYGIQAQSLKQDSKMGRKERGYHLEFLVKQVKKLTAKEIDIMVQAQIKMNGLIYSHVEFKNWAK